MLFAKVDEVDATTTYVGVTVSGNSTADPVWNIFRLTTTGADLDVEQPLNYTKKNGVWDDRATYTYG